jgi:dienelactone hydrolase
MADSTIDTSGPDGIWYFSIGPSTGDLRENNELNQGDTEPGYRCTVTIEGAAGSLVSGSGHTDFIDSVSWAPDSRLLQFRRVGPDYREWHRGTITYGVYVGRFAREAARDAQPGITRYNAFASGWNSSYLDTHIVPRVYEVLIGTDRHGRLRLDRAPLGQEGHVGRLKIYQGPGCEEFEYDVDVRRWDGSYLEFVRRGDTRGSYHRAVATYRAVAVGRLLVGTADIAGEPGTVRWKAARAEVLGHGLSPRPQENLLAWQVRTRAQIKSLLMAGNPARLNVTAPALSQPPGLSSDQRSDIPPGRDDDLARHPADYTLTKLTFDLEVQNPYGTGTIKRKLKAYLALPFGDPAHPPEAVFPAVIALNGHHGSAWTCMCPCSTLYWFGDAFARLGYAVLAVNVGHRTSSQFYNNGAIFGDPYDSDNTPAGDYDCTDGQSGDGPDNHPQPPITAPRMGPSDWADDGERTWKVLQAYEWLRQQPYIDAERVLVTGLSLGGRIATYVGALEPRLAAVLPAGFSPDLGLRRNLGRSESEHRCNFWDRADIREYIDTSDLHALVAPRLLIVQTGKQDETYSSFKVGTGPNAVPAYFAGDKQVARRTRAAYAQWPGAFIHYLHYDKHRYHTGVVAPAQPGAQRFVQQPVQVGPPPGEPWDVSWQADPGTADDGLTLFDLLP